MEERKDRPAPRPATHGGETVEVTPEMIEAGMRALLRMDIAAADLDEMRLALADAFKEMVAAVRP